MLTLKQHELLRLLANSSNYLTSEQISEKLGLSTKTIQRYIKSINQQIADLNVEIISTRGQGLLLQGQIEDLYFLLDDHVEGFDKARIKDIVLLILEYQPISTERLSELIMYSSSTLSKLMKGVKAYLSQFHLELTSKPHYGVEIQGSEVCIRKMLMCAGFDIGTNFNIDCGIRNINPNEFKFIQNQLSLMLQNNDLMILDEDALTVLKELTVCISRLKKDKFVIEESNATIPELNALILKISQELTIEIPADEINHLSLKYNTLFQEARKINREIDFSIISFVLDACQKIENHFGDVQFDKEVVESLVVHLHLYFKRMGYRSASNPLLEGIEERYKNEYQYAKMYSTLILKQYGIQIEMSELVYIIVYFAMNQYRRNNKRTRISIICNYGLATTKLIEERILDELKDIEIIDTYPLYSLNIALEQDVDIIVSTVPLDQTDKTVVVVRSLCNDDFIVKLKEAIKQHQK